MRVTESMMKIDSLAALQAAAEDEARATEKISSGKEVYKPSDDPLRFVTAARFKSALRGREQYVRNISDATRFLENNEAAVQRVVGLLQQTRTLLVRNGNDSYTTADLRLTAQELRQTLDSLIQFANSETVDGKIFGGTKTDTDPFEAVKDANGDVTHVIYRGNKTPMQRAIGENSTIDVNFIGSKLFQVDPDRIDSSFDVRYPGQAIGDVDDDGNSVADFPDGDATGYFTVQGRRISFDTANDSLLDIAARINDKAPEVTASVEGTLTGTATVAASAAATAATAGHLVVNGTTIAIPAGASLDQVVAAFNSVSGSTGVTASAEAVAGGYALRLDGGLEVDDTRSGSSDALRLLGATSGVPAPDNLSSRSPLAYRLRIASAEPDQLITDDEGSGRFLARLGIKDETANAPANNGAGATEDLSIFDVLIRAIDDLENGRFEAIRTDRLGELDRGLAHMNDAVGDIGGMARRLELAADREENLMAYAKKIISDNEDLDYGKAVSDLRQAQLKLQTALGAAGNLPLENLLKYF